MKTLCYYTVVILAIIALRVLKADDEWQHSDSWDLGTNESIPKPEIIVDPYRENCSCPEE